MNKHFKQIIIFLSFDDLNFIIIFIIYLFFFMFQKLLTVIFKQMILSLKHNHVYQMLYKLFHIFCT